MIQSYRTGLYDHFNPPILPSDDRGHQIIPPNKIRLDARRILSDLAASIYREVRTPDGALLGHIEIDHDLGDREVLFYDTWSEPEGMYRVQLTLRDFSIRGHSFSGLVRCYVYNGEIGKLLQLRSREFVPLKSVYLEEPHHHTTNHYEQRAWEYIQAMRVWFGCGGVHAKFESPYWLLVQVCIKGRWCFRFTGFDMTKSSEDPLRYFQQLQREVER